MDGLGIAGLGAGALRGLDRFRRYEREDADEKRRESGEVRAEQTHGLSMRTGEQGYSQREQLFPEQLKSLQQSNSYNEQANPFRIDALGLSNDQADLTLDFSKETMPARKRAIERTDASGERTEQSAMIESEFKKAMYGVANGDMSAWNTYNQAVADAHKIPIQYVMNPGSKPGYVKMKDITDDSGKNDKEITMKELFSMGTPDRLAKSFEVKPTKGMVVDKQLVDPYTGRVMLGKSGNANGQYGQLKSSEFNLLDGRNSRFFGKLDKQGQIFLSGDAKYQKDEANKRTMELIDANVPAWKSELIARNSVGGTRDPSLIKSAAEDAAIQQGINPDSENYNSFINTYMQTNDATGQRQAEDEYRRIVLGQKAGLSSATVNGQQQPAQMPTVGSDAEYDALPAGATFINSADGKTYKKN